MSPIDLIVGLAVVGFGLGPLLFGNLIRSRMAHARMERWREAARDAGLSRLEPAGGSLIASWGSTMVRISAYQETDTERTQIELWGERLAPGLSLGPEPRGSLLGSRHPKEIEVGHEDFDRQVSVQGAPALALALLDADMRRTVSAMLRGRLQVRGHRPLWASGRVRDAVLRIELPERSRVARGTRREHDKEPFPAGDAYLDGEYNLSAVLRAALDLAARLVAPADLARRLASNLALEPEAGVRLNTLLTLLREFPEHEATREAVRAARDDPDAELRVRAGIALGADGRDTLLGVAGGEGAEDATSARAVAALFRSLTLAEAAGLLKTALRTRRLATAKECLTVLGRRGRDAIPSLAKVLLVEKGELGEAAAEALGATGDASAEAPLLRALAEGPLGIRHAVAWALGQVGTRDAVAPLREAETADASLRGAARQAIAQIHARLAGAERGQLSLAGGEAGRLSIAEDESGRLSLSEPHQFKT